MADNQLDAGRRGHGRPRSIPQELFETILQLYAAGKGYRSIASHLRSLGLGTTHTTVRRLILGIGCYRICPTCGGSGRIPNASRRVLDK